MMILSNEIIDDVNYMCRDERLFPSLSATAESGILVAGYASGTRRRAMARNNQQIRLE
jgi:hypothetical protein